MSSSITGALDGAVGPAALAASLLAACWLGLCLFSSSRPRDTRPVPTTGPRRRGAARTGIALLGAAGLLGSVPSAAAVAAGAPRADADRGWSLHLPAGAAGGRTAPAVVGVDVHRPVDGDGPDARPDLHLPGPTRADRSPSLWPVGPPHGTGRIAGPADADTVVVHRGDTLWALAAGSLRSGASAAAIRRAVHAWHRLNAAVIGADPDLILPGQVLHAPPRSTATTNASTT